MSGDHWVLSRAELAYLARLMAFDRLLYLDGGAGLAHLGADFDSARATLTDQGVLDPRTVEHQDPVLSSFHGVSLALRSLKASTHRAEVNVDPGRHRMRQAHLFGIADGDVVTIGPGAISSLFVLEVFPEQELSQRIMQLSLITEGADISEHPLDVSPTFSLSHRHLTEVRRLVDTGDLVAAGEVLTSLRWSGDYSTLLVRDLVDTTHSVDVRAVVRTGSRLAIESCTWFRSRAGSWWQFEAELVPSQVVFTRTTKGQLLKRLTGVMDVLTW
jgi:hypothetical protein